SASALAKARALEKMKAAPKPTAEEIAELNARRLEQEARQEAKRAAARAAKEEQAQKEEAERLAKLAAIPTEADRKAARDARYAARKKRKS
ncbi:MAG TPA: hypothetical protein VEZ26_10510, partial [Sphingomonadaceae bacterium]|nr:hypothetical protein [Sphingomonadaceae bacterium]